MEAITLKPEVLDRIFRSLPPEDRVEILSIGAAFRRLSLEKQLVLAQSKVQEFEARYNTTLHQLESEGLPDDADYAMHEDYVEWHYWSRVLEQTRKTLDALAAISSVDRDLARKPAFLKVRRTSEVRRTLPRV